MPLLNIDPYFSVWSFSDRLNESTTVHWTGKPNTMIGVVKIDGKPYRYMGVNDKMPEIPQTKVDITAFSTEYTFRNEMIELKVLFTSPRIPDDLYLASAPFAYIKISARIVDGKEHKLAARFSVGEEICLDTKGQHPVACEKVSVSGCSDAVKIGSTEQNVLWRSGDDVRIDWGYFYLASLTGECGYKFCDHCGMNVVFAEADITEKPALFIAAYDDIASINYFGINCKSYWNNSGETVTECIAKAASSYDEVFARTEAFSDRLFIDAVRAGGEKYADILSLAIRQVMAAHKIIITPDGEIAFISKECFSNGCAATVDVSYPSIPMFLLYNPELVKGMMRPIMKYALSEAWPFNFAPHDAGQYPLVRGQVYNGTDASGQMPLEECGNMLVMAAAVSVADGSADFAAEYMDTFKVWAKYLTDNGADPANQLCTDDFAGHMAHNCNLTLKAVMGIEGYAIILDMLGKNDESAPYHETARKMAADWCVNADNGDGSRRLAFDRPGTYSMKYNAVWDKLFGTNIFPKDVITSEIASNFRHFGPYGMPLDNRATYTKSDWLVWTATMAGDDDTFCRYIEPLWNAYNYSLSRIPLTDWYDTITGNVKGFRHRSVQGGLFIKLLDYSGKMKLVK